MNESNVKDLLALGEEEITEKPFTKPKIRNIKADSDSEMEDWEEVKGKEKNKKTMAKIQVYIIFILIKK